MVAEVNFLRAAEYVDLAVAALVRYLGPDEGEHILCAPKNQHSCCHQVTYYLPQTISLVAGVCLAISGTRGVRLEL